MRQSFFFNKVADLKPLALLKKRLWHRSFPVNLVKFLRTPFLTEHLRWLLLGSFVGCQATWCFSRNAVFSWIKIIFFGDVTLRCISSGQGHLCFLAGGGNIVLVTPTHIYRKYHISTCFLIKIIFFHFPPKEKISYFLEKRNTIFPDITKKYMFRREFLGKTIFSEHLKKISYFQEFF